MFSTAELLWLELVVEVRTVTVPCPACLPVQSQCRDATSVWDPGQGGRCSRGVSGWRAAPVPTHTCAPHRPVISPVPTHTCALHRPVISFSLAMAPVSQPAPAQRNMKLNIREAAELQQEKYGDLVRHAELL